MKYFVILFSILTAFNLPAQSMDPLVTDRPDQTESSSTVPSGHLQIETGFVYDNFEHGSKTIKSLNIATTLFRFGLTDNFEIRVASSFLDQTIKQSDVQIKEAGIGGLDIGTKIFCFEETYYLPETSIIANFNLPVGAESFVGGKITPSVILAMSNTVAYRIGLGYNLGIEFTEDSQTIYFLSAAVGIGITNKLSCFVESYNFVSNQNNPQLFTDAGFTYLINNDFQLDASAGYGLNNETTSWFINAGLSFRISVL